MAYNAFWQSVFVGRWSGGKHGIGLEIKEMGDIVASGNEYK
jgi:hypothetical protein